MVGCLNSSQYAPGLTDVYILEMDLPPCQTIMRVGYYGICARRDGEEFRCTNTGYSAQPNETYGKLVPSDRNPPLGTSDLSKCPTMQAVEAALGFQSKIFHSLQVGAPFLFTVGLIALLCWAWLRMRCIRAISWWFLITSPIVSVVSTISVWQIASGIVYTYEKFGGPIPMYVGHRLLMLQCVAFGLLVVDLLWIHYIARPQWMDDTLRSAANSKRIKKPASVVGYQEPELPQVEEVPQAVEPPQAKGVPKDKKQLIENERDRLRELHRPDLAGLQGQSKSVREVSNTPSHIAQVIHEG